MLGAVVLSPTSLDPIINDMSVKYGVDPALIRAHIKAESNWDVNASRYEAQKGDASWGLMQLLLATAKEILGRPDLTTTQLIQPQNNIEAGTAYIAKQLKRYNGDVKSAISAYNAGTARKDSSGKFSNQAYVDKVYNNMLMYQTVGVAVSAEDFDPTVNIGAGVIYAAIGVVGVILLYNNT